MTRAVATAAIGRGGINRVVLGHGHADHRGTAPGLAAPVYCHADARADAEGDGGRRYMDLSELRAYARPVFGHLLDFWDGGPVRVDGTIAEGDEVSGFRAVVPAWSRTWSDRSLSRARRRRADDRLLLHA